jgi:hypothetical protein
MSRSRDADAERYEALKRSVGDVGWIRHGSVARRFMPCGKPGCRCKARPPQLHGPYYQWTRKVSGKTVTVRLSPDEAKLMEEWIANGRRLRRIVAAMETVSHRLTEPRLREARRTAPARPARRR